MLHFCDQMLQHYQRKNTPGKCCFILYGIYTHFKLRFFFSFSFKPDHYLQLKLTCEINYSYAYIPSHDYFMYFTHLTFI